MNINIKILKLTKGYLLSINNVDYTININEYGTITIENKVDFYTKNFILSILKYYARNPVQIVKITN